MDISDAIAIVKADLNQGFERALTIEYCEMLSGPDNEPLVVVHPGRGLAAAYWQIIGTDDREGFPGMFATGQRVVFDGVTLVEHDAHGEPLVTRVVDWSLVHAQLGVFPGRQVAYSEMTIA